MKTEKFDEEFRRKLLGLPAEADPGEVERIQGFVNANKPALPSFGWGKLLLYGGSSLLLIGSLSYNVIQTYRNSHLQSSIDSLAHRSVDPTASREVIRHDTVYITRSGNAPESTSLPSSLVKITPQKPMEQTDANPSTDTQPRGSVAMERPKLLKPGSENKSNQAVAVSPRSGSTGSNLPVPTIDSRSTVHKQRSEGRELPGQLQTKTTESAASLPPVSVERLITKKTRQTKEPETLPKSIPIGAEEVEKEPLTSNLSPATRASNRPSAKGRQTRSGKGKTGFTTEREGQLATNQSLKQDQRTIKNPKAAGFTPVVTENANSNVAVSEFNRQTIRVELLASRKQVQSTQWAIISPSHLLVVPKSELSARATHRPWHLTMPTLSVPNAQYRLGAGFTGGSDQVGGALLGEIMLNRHWSVQTGVQLGYNQGFHFRDEQDFNEHQKEDFRQTYAPQVSSSADIQNIKQMTQLVQVPIQVAYHFSFGRQWGLRLGLGTDLKLWERSTVSFDYRESSRSSEHELSRSKDHVHTVNNLILSTAMERSWRKWQFRAGPFISPQLRPADYKRDDLSWGANLQVLYRLGK